MRGAAHGVVVVFAALCASCSFPDFQADETIADAGEDDTLQDSAFDTRRDAPDTGIDTAIDTGIETDESGVCGAPPTLHPGAGVYCPFTADGGATTCAAGEMCCEGSGFIGSVCVATTGTCPVSTTEWQCDAPSSCGGGQVCCGNGTPTLRPGCTYDWIRPPQGSVCAAMCSPSQYMVCEVDSDCPTGRKCIPLKSGGVQIGFCG